MHTSFTVGRYCWVYFFTFLWYITTLSHRGDLQAAVSLFITFPQHSDIPTILFGALHHSSPPPRHTQRICCSVSSSDRVIGWERLVKKAPPPQLEGWNRSKRGRICLHRLWFSFRCAAFPSEHLETCCQFYPRSARFFDSRIGKHGKPHCPWPY